jgi:purine/pyrimidine-nucleoside phosphorylase
LIGHNSYFSGGVQSLGFQSERGRATVGVITPGEYKFGTAVPEHMVITSGSLAVRLPGENWRTIAQGGSFDVAAGKEFEVRAAAAVSYICFYRDPPPAT